MPLTPTQCVYTSQYCEENAWKLAQQLVKRLTAEDGRVESKEESESAGSDIRPDLSLLPAESVYPSLVDDRVFVVFVSNAFSEVRLFRQRIGDPAKDGSVLWDYHVFVVVKPAATTLAQTCRCGEGEQCPCGAWIFDLDTTLPFPCALATYARHGLRAHLATAGRPVSAASSSAALAARRRRERLFRVVGATDFLANFASDRSHMLAPVQLLTAVQEARAIAREGQPPATAISSTSAVPAVVPSDEPVALRREVAEERETRAAERASWQRSPLRDRLRSEEEDDAPDAEWNARAVRSRYLAPPPVYPPIRTAAAKHNLDEYRFFRHPDSGRGVVMNQEEFLDFFHVPQESLQTVETQTTGTNTKKARR